MSIKSDKWIRRMAQQGMIEPFESGQVRDSEKGRVISYGTSSYGYDVRCSDEFKIFTNINSVIVDPKNFDPNSFVDIKSDVCIIPPNSFALARTVEFFRIPRDVLTICLGKSTYARCFSGDTRVALLDGTAPTLEEMVKRAEQGEVFWGYSIGQCGQIVAALLEAPRYIGRDQLIEIELDSGETIACTPDHKFLSRDGRMVEAGNLRPGSSLMPLYRSVRRGYEMIYQTSNNRMYPTHRLADEWNLRHGVYNDEMGTHRQHIDNERRNNYPWNITRMEAGEHLRYHNQRNYGDGFDAQEHAAAIKAGIQRLAQQPQWQENFSQVQQRALNFWHDDKYAAMREKILTQRQNPSDATRFAHSQATLARYADPQVRGQHSELMQQAWLNDDARRLKQAEIARQINIREEITAEVVREVLDKTDSIRGAANYLHCDRSVFRRFPEQLDSFRSTATRNHKVAAVRTRAGEHDVYCLTVPEAGNFALEAGVFVSNCGIIVNVTPLEPEWEGHVTLEFSNTTTLPAKIYANEGVAQMLFFGSDEVCETSYKDRGGKYQGQTGVTLPKA
jgi:dCTP deaminase